MDVTITAQEILVDNASYPTERIGRNSHDYRPLGIGYANLGALLMSLALPYDSDGGRDVCGAITALMTGESYAQSARIAERMGPFGGYPRNRESMLDVIRMHRDSLRPIKEENVQPSLLHAAQESWDDGARTRRKVRLQEFAGFRARSHGHHRLHDGLRYHRHRARSRAGEAEAAGRRRRNQDRQQHGAAGADEARISAGAGGADRGLH